MSNWNVLTSDSGSGFDRARVAGDGIAVAGARVGDGAGSAGSRGWLARGVIAARDGGWRRLGRCGERCVYGWDFGRNARWGHCETGGLTGCRWGGIVAEWGLGGPSRSLFHLCSHVFPHGRAISCGQGSCANVDSARCQWRSRLGNLCPRCLTITRRLVHDACVAGSVFGFASEQHGNKREDVWLVCRCLLHA